jgi:hypothetical protein
MSSENTPSLPLYEPPALDSDEPLDAIERALVRALLPILVREIRADLAAHDDQRDTRPVMGSSHEPAGRRA